MKKLLLTLSSLCVFLIAVHAQSTHPAPYCNASFDDMQGFDVDDHIDLVSFGNLSNASDSQYAYPHYVFYNNLQASYNTGSTYALKVKFTVAGSAGYGIWIDYNHNNAFDSTELVSGSTSSTSTYLAYPADSVMLSVTIPATATLGATRMRVRIVEDDQYHGAHGPKELPCNIDTTATNTMDWGETEDYTLTIGSLTGIEEAHDLSAISLYPNPANSLITLQMPDQIEGYTYTVMNLLGQVVSKELVSAAKQSIDISSLSEGIYMVKVSNADLNTSRVLKFEKR